MKTFAKLGLAAVLVLTANAQEIVGFTWSPSSSLIIPHWGGILPLPTLHDRVNQLPCPLNFVTAGKQRGITGHAVKQEPFVCIG